MARNKFTIHSDFTKHETITDLSILAFLWIIAAVIVNPLGNFPINDDWSYGAAVQHLLDEGAFRPTVWTAVPLLSQALWGALFCIPFGFSFTALRFSTLVLGLLGCMGTYVLLRELESGRRISLLASLILAFNPIYFALSNTFMTDVPFTSFMVFAVYFLIRGLRRGSDRNLIVGAFLSTASILCRQQGLFLPVAFALTVVSQKGFSIKWMWRAGLPLAMALSAMVGLEIGLKGANILFPTLSHSTVKNLFSVLRDPLAVFWQFKSYLFAAVLYFGIFLMPFFIAVRLPVWKLEKWKIMILTGLVILFPGYSLYHLFRIHKTMPLLGNILDKGGIGPLTLRDIYVLKLSHSPVFPEWFWILVTAVCIFGGALLLVRIFCILNEMVIERKNANRSDDIYASLLILFSMILYFLPIVLVVFMDRYLIPMIPLLCAAMILWNRKVDIHFRKRGLVTAIVFVFLMSAFSVATTRDYLTWNRIRWNALQTLMKNNVSPAAIDGGFEFNGWYFFKQWNAQHENSSKSAFGLTDRSKSWWWVVDDSLMMTFGDVEGYEVVGEYPFTRWIPPAGDTLFLLCREPEPAKPDSVKNDTEDVFNSNRKSLE